MRGDDQIERLEELLPLGRRKTRQQLLVGGGGARLRLAQRLGALRRQLDRIGPGIVLGAAALDQPAAEQAPDDIGKRGAVDAGPLDQVGLGQSLLLGDDGEHGELARRKPAVRASDAKMSAAH